MVARTSSLVRPVPIGDVERELVLHEPSLQHIRELFARRGRPMPERNVIQAMFPPQNLGCL